MGGSFPEPLGRERRGALARRLLRVVSAKVLGLSVSPLHSSLIALLSWFSTCTADTVS